MGRQPSYAAAVHRPCCCTALRYRSPPGQGSGTTLLIAESARLRGGLRGNNLDGAAVRIGQRMASRCQRRACHGAVDSKAEAEGTGLASGTRWVEFDDCVVCKNGGMVLRAVAVLLGRELQPEVAIEASAFLQSRGVYH